MSTPQPPHGSVSTRAVRIAAVAGGAVLIVGLAIAVGTAGGGKPPAEPSPTPTSQATQAPQVTTAPASPPPQTGGSSPSATSARPVVRWHGTLIVSGPDAHRDLDSIPPRTYQRDADLTGDWLDTSLKGDSAGVQMAILQSGTSATFAACRDVVAATGTDHLDQVQTGDVLCVITSQGRVAMLRTTRATQTSAEPILKFVVTVWDPPLPRG